jgi:hypothetical protein
LRRAHAIAAAARAAAVGDWTITVWLASTVAMVESFAAIVILGASTFEIILLLTATTVCLLTAIPAILLMPVVSECERELRARRELPAEYRLVEQRLPRYVGRVCFCLVLAVVANAAFR